MTYGQLLRGVAVTAPGSSRAAFENIRRLLGKDAGISRRQPRFRQALGRQPDAQTRYDR